MSYRYNGRVSILRLVFGHNIKWDKHIHTAKMMLTVTLRIMIYYAFVHCFVSNEIVAQGEADKNCTKRLENLENKLL